MLNSPEDLNCRLCHSSELQLFLLLANSPNNISYLLEKENVSKDKPLDLKVYLCSQCGFVQLSSLLMPNYYDDYLMTVSHSQQMRDYQHSQASTFIKKFNLYGKKVIEVGCGDGNYLSTLIDLGVNAFGVEPSSKFRNIALAKRLNIFEGYVDSQLPIPESPYDAFVTRQVLEHIDNVHEFLQGIRLSLSTDAVGLIEVPSIEQSIEKGRFYDFFSDHVNYFSVRTLSYALERNGFLVLDIQRGMNGEYLQAYVKVDSLIDQSNLQESVNILTQDIHQLLSQADRDHKKVAVWGAGAKGLSSLAISQVFNVEYVIDSDNFKHGLFTPVTHLPIVPPQKLLESPVDIVIITAMAYLDEIVKELHDNFQFNGTIVSLGNNLKVIE
jgi:SAM-dependent methyltransferase